jgi:tRNA dimethylallyltransferase
LWLEDRELLHRRISERFQHMLDSGFVEEVTALAARPGFSPDLPSMRAVGYRQLLDYVLGKQTLDQACWMRSQPDLVRIDAEDKSAYSLIYDAVAKTETAT